MHGWVWIRECGSENCWSETWDFELWLWIVMECSSNDLKRPVASQTCFAHDVERLEAANACLSHILSSRWLQRHAWAVILSAQWLQRHAWAGISSAQWLRSSVFGCFRAPSGSGAVNSSVFGAPTPKPPDGLRGPKGNLCIDICII